MEAPATLLWEPDGPVCPNTQKQERLRSLAQGLSAFSPQVGESTISTRKFAVGDSYTETT